MFIFGFIRPWCLWWSLYSSSPLVSEGCKVINVSSATFKKVLNDGDPSVAVPVQVAHLMAGGGETGVDLSRKFVSEAELDKRRQQRQEEWEKVRKPDDPESKNVITSPHHSIILSIHMCMYSLVCVCTLTHMYISLHVYISIYIYTCVLIYVRTCIYKHVPIHTHTRI